MEDALKGQARDVFAETTVSARRSQQRQHHFDAAEHLLLPAPSPLFVQHPAHRALPLPDLAV